MKIAVVCLTFLLAVNTAWCSSSEQFIAVMKSKMFDDYSHRLSVIEGAIALCPGYETDLKEALTETERCWKSSDSQNETQCELLRKNLQKCVKPVVNIFETCLPRNVTEIPQLVVDVIAKISEYICSTDGEHLFELFNPCFTMMNYTSQRCAMRLKAKYQQAQEHGFSKELVCTLVHSSKGCFESHLNRSCTNKKTREAFLTVYNIMVTECEGEIEMTNEISSKGEDTKKEVAYELI